MIYGHDIAITIEVLKQRVAVLLLLPFVDCLPNLQRFWY
jgi:hypothetical protein